jgi:hypothetical protein
MQQDDHRARRNVTRRDHRLCVARLQIALRRSAPIDGHCFKDPLIGNCGGEAAGPRINRIAS